MIDTGFDNSHSESSLFTLDRNSKKVWLLVYVDDLIFIDNCNQNVKFKCRNLRELRYFLGMEAIHKDETICLNQSKYGMELLLRFRLFEAKPSPTQVSLRSKLNKETEDLLEDITLYRQMFGCIRKLTMTHPNIRYVVNYVAEFL